MAEVPEPTIVEGFDPPPGIPLELRQVSNPGTPPVLLLHGASAQHETFRIPRSRSLSDFLWEEGYEPWLLDWRGSRRVTDAMDVERLEENRYVLDLDHAAREDIPWALRTIMEARDHEDFPKKHKIHIVAHCLGAAVLAQMIAAGDTSFSDRLGRIVLLTIGLFYEPPLDGKLKGQLSVLDRLWTEGDVHVIDPGKPEIPSRWPPGLRSIYNGIGPGLRPHPGADAEPKCSHALCNRVSFMYGTPFRHPNLVDEIHGVWRVKFSKGRAKPRVGERLQAVFVDGRSEKPAAESGEPPVDASSALPVPHSGVGVVSHVQPESGSWRRGDAKGTLLLSGCAGEFPPIVSREGDEPVVYYELRAQDQSIGICDGSELSGSKLDEVKPGLWGQFGGIPLRMYLQGALNVRRRWAAKFSTDRSVELQGDKVLISAAARERFHKLPAVTLITGEHNQLWHRDSINRMHEWITAGLNRKARERFTKVIIPSYGHQDLLWGKKSWDEVFPIILGKGLDGPGTSILVDDDPPGPTPGPTPIG
ncbi:MAG: alpha/beta hydrolase [Myxococcales bacterium]|nr:alpha/beta hydrolase [Myxococcales bacterium]